MTQMSQILELVRQGVERDKYPELTGLTMAQIESALNNLQFKGLIKIETYRSRGRHCGRLCSEYVLTDAAKPPYKRKDRKPIDVVAYAQRNVANSVFALCK